MMAEAIMKADTNMFQISDDDLLWDDDFPVEDITFDEGTDSTRGNKLMSIVSLPAKLLPQEEMGLGSLKCEINSSASTPLLSQLSANDCYKKNNQDGKTLQAETLPKLCKRMFPGPAGILPPYSPSVVLDTKLPDSPDIIPQPKSPNVDDLKDGLQPSQLSWSQAASDDVFKSPQWKELVTDLGTDSESLIAKFSIKSALLKASRKLLHRGKIPLIIGVIDSLEMQGSDASIVIRDPSGKMNGALHRDLFKDQSTALQLGSVLVLRQVSVISPSLRTHYLNITPGNVALIYTANKQGAVSTQLTNGFETESSVSKKQFLYQIIKTSEQELSNAVKIAHQRSKSHVSPSLENLNKGLNSRYSSPVMPKGPLMLQRNQMNVTPFGRGSSLFSCSPQSVTNVAHGKVVTPYSSVKMTGNGRIICPKQAMSNPTQVQGNRFPIQNYYSTYADRNPTPTFQQSRPQFNSPNVSSTSGNQFPAKSASRFQFSSCQNLNKDTIHDKTSQFQSWSSDIPQDDVDDQMLLSFCDDVFNENLEGACSGDRVIIGSNPSGAFPREEGMRNNSKCGYIISEVFSDCRKENERISNNSMKENVCKASSFTSHLGDKLKSEGSGLKLDTSIISRTVNNFPALPQVGEAAKKFTFKRCLPPSDVLQLPVPVKRSACRVAHPTIDTAQRKTFIHSNSLSGVNTSVVNCDNIQPRLRPHLPVVEHSTVNSTVPRVDRCVPSVNLAVSMGQQTVSSSVFSNTGVNIKQAICSKGLAESGCNSGRDSGIAGHSSMFQVWDSDLNDEMLLSQLSDEF